MSEQIAVPESLKAFVDTVAERWGYYIGKRLTQSQLMKETVAERAQVRALGASISSKIEEWMNEGTDTREEIRAIQGELVQAKQVLKAKSTPFYDKMRPLTKALSYLDKVVIPSQLREIRGEEVTPKFQVSETILKAITKPPK